ncbi:SAM-dependent methyltransferase [Pectobacterium parvum]|uniref:SAM-dependent methyltransferase n=2 Tax=Pectobacterium parvum TaxID=2778550 RepID=A0ABW8FTK4_9GAMM|nr:MULTISPECIES: SAM-dependent methyltransferase [Pectobacterium]MCU1802179.1 hypothetical protein [Pectobacterium parvum]UFK37601.1 SAM-dependent methyltransferase [Pectobacterium parvum]UVD95698.1 SAM-dependent methyltransferase [Pectobacterium parvum]GKW43780.1 hypothetical protein PEC301879_36380 [Pectobacterium carotovorum subsp. carotovorum]
MLDIHHSKCYPQKKERTQAWEDLARDIAKANVHNGGVVAGGAPGKLTIIGSGIEAVSFSRQDENFINTADYVFYCVADPATVVWIKEQRPDAFDLYVFYDDSKPRYATYMQMTEAMLHHVRRGKHVVGVYYGHPGIFVLSTHRAIEIARKEGHTALMRPGISALDCLCADLGVDPSSPGLQTYEASDMMIRDKQPDTAAHVVLWQVGLIGELGYRRLGYLNNNFILLVDYLKAFYSEDHTVINYVASRYPGIPPTIEQYCIRDLYDPSIQQKVTGISTFYLPPKDIRPINPERAIQLGLLKPGHKPLNPSSPLRKIAEYSKKEKRALDALVDFKVPAGYKWQEDTLAARFIVELLQNPDLLKRYEANSFDALSTPPFQGMGEREMKLMASKDPGMVQIAAKGLHKRSAGNRALLDDIVRHPRIARRIIKTKKISQLHDLFEHYGVSYNELPHDAARAGQRTAYVWSGIYYDANTRTVICMLAPFSGHNKIALYINGEAIHRADFHNGCLSWKTEGGNQTEGMFRFARTNRYRTVAVGSISANGRAGYAEGRIDAVALMPFTASTAKLAEREAIMAEQIADLFSGSYLLRRKQYGISQILEAYVEGCTLFLNGKPVPLCRREGNSIVWQGKNETGRLSFVFDPLSGTHHCFGVDESGSGLTGMKKLEDGVVLRPVPWFELGVPEAEARYITQFARLGADSGGILFWANWQKIVQSNLATAKLTVLLEQE